MYPELYICPYIKSKRCKIIFIKSRKYFKGVLIKYGQYLFFGFKIQNKYFKTIHYNIFVGDNMKRIDFKKLIGVFFLVFSLLAVVPGISLAQNYKFAVSLGWMENESGQRQKRGFEDAFKELGGTATYTDANYDAKKQSEQIEAFIKMKPDALFITPSDPAGISAAVKRAIDAGIPTFVADAVIAGAATGSAVASSDFGMGVYNLDYIAKKIGFKGNIGIIDLPGNESWDLRGQGARWALRKYPNIKVVAKWSWDFDATLTPRQAVDNMLTANPKKGDLDAIWCAWDGAAMEGALAIKAAGRSDEIFTTGIDGGKVAFDFIQSGTPFKHTLAQSIYTMSYMTVYYAHEFLKGNQVPRTVIAPVFSVDKEKLDNLDAKNPEDYDMPGVAAKFGWERVL
jgi:ribose transport system substrate-binding protein